jgi:hypothetical protein
VPLSTIFVFTISLKPGWLNEFLLIRVEFFKHGKYFLISAISWRPVLVVEEAGVPGENQ